MENLTHGVQMIAQERQKQIYKHGFTAEHHADHPEWYEQGQLQYAAMALLSQDGEPEKVMTETPVNWDFGWFQNLLQRNPYERVKIAGALLAAELDRQNEIRKRENPSAGEVISSINERLCLLLNDEDLTDEKLRNASEFLLPNIQADCAKVMLR